MAAATDPVRGRSISRRQFIIGVGAAGTGLAVGVLIDSRALGTIAPDEVNAWVVIDPDDTVTIRIARSEMGQGTLTGLAQLVAEELECDWQKVQWEFPTPGESLKRERVWGGFSTGGSRGIRGSHQYVREGGAVAREMLVEAAAKNWGVKQSECTVANGIISHARSGRETSYGKVAAAAAKLAPPKTPKLKDPKDWKLIGKAVKRLDTAEKVTGELVYGADVELDGMLNAAIRQCPILSGTVKSYDAKAIEQNPGVRKVVPVGDNAVAVIADSWWQAKTALDELPIEWNEGEHANFSSAAFTEVLNEGLEAEQAFVGNQNGDFKGNIAGAAKTIAAIYSVPHQHHATMEPMNATAKWTPERCEVWCPTQNGEGALAATAKAAALPIEQCEVYKTILGGGFGRRGNSDYIEQAVTIAKAVPGTPVKLLWSREEDMRQGMYHPTTKAKLVGGLDAEGNLESLHVRISGQSILAALNPSSLRDGMDPLQFQAFLPDVGGPASDHAFIYSVPNLLVDHAMRNPPMRPGFWRGVNANQNVLYMECFMDELADAAGQDPLSFRRKILKEQPRALGVLNAAADQAGWGTEPGKGQGRGLAVCKAFGSFVAACAEVTVQEDGNFTIDRIVAATDPGYAVNPQQIDAQVAGSFVYGLSAMLYSQVTWKDGQTEQTNFHTYPSMRIAAMPTVETIVMPTGGDVWGGVGEPTIAVAAPAVLNAIFAASGRRLREFPLGGTKLPSA